MAARLASKQGLLLGDATAHRTQRSLRCFIQTRTLGSLEKTKSPEHQLTRASLEPQAETGLARP